MQCFPIGCSPGQSFRALGTIQSIGERCGASLHRDQLRRAAAGSRFGLREPIGEHSQQPCAAFDHGSRIGYLVPPLDWAFYEAAPATESRRIRGGGAGTLASTVIYRGARPLAMIEAGRDPGDTAWRLRAQVRLDCQWQDLSNSHRSPVATGCRTGASIRRWPLSYPVAQQHPVSLVWQGRETTVVRAHHHPGNPTNAGRSGPPRHCAEAPQMDALRPLGRSFGPALGGPHHR